MKVSALYFSPTGSTKKVALAAAESMGTTVTEVDLTASKVKTTLAQNEMAVFALPVFMGRIPPAAVEKIRAVKGEGTPAVAMVVYGNGAYEDALLELCDILAEQGFTVISAGAFIGQHSMDYTEELGGGRPNADDIKDIAKVAQTAKEKWEAGNKTPVTVAGNRPYIERPAAQRPILVAESCTACGACATQCPVGAIPADNVHETDLDVCFSCMRCIHICPVGARNFPAPVTEKLHDYLQQYMPPEENELFV